MYDYLKGEYAYCDQNSIVIDCSGVGYKVFTSQRCIQDMPEPGSFVTVYTFLSVRDDALDLYGFLEKEDISLFRLLITVSGVGPKVALALLSCLSSGEIARAIVTGDQAMLTTSPGIGPKVAQRVILELRDKISNDMLLSGSVETVAGGASTTRAHANFADEAVSALMALGYSKNQSAAAVRSVVTDSMTVEEMIKAALKALMR